MDPTSRFQYIAGELCKTQTKLTELKYEESSLNEKIEFLKLWKKDLEKEVCTGCNGLGTIRHFIAQDEIEMLVCRKCKGTGLPK